MTTEIYDLNWLMERLGSEATEDDAQAALERASDWHNDTPKADVLAWHDQYRSENPHAESIYGADGDLVENWNQIVIFSRAASLE